MAAMSETLTWLAIGTIIVLYVSQVKVVKTTLPPPPSTQREVDVTRWRHDGTQPATMGDWTGNGERLEDPEVLALRHALAF